MNKNTTNNVAYDTAFAKIDARGSVVVFGLAVMLSILFSLLSSVLVQYGNGGREWNFVQFWIINSIYSLLLGTLAVVYAVVFSKQNNAVVLSTLKTDKMFKWQDLLIMLTMIFVLINVSTVINDLFCKLLNFDDSLSGVQQSYFTDNLFVALLCACLLPAINEELLFRAVIGQGFANTFNKVTAVLLSGFVFALFHFNPSKTIHQFALGALLMLFVIRNASIWIAVIGHFFNNAVAVIMTTFVDTEKFYTENGLWIVIVGVIILAGLLFVLTRFSKQSKHHIVSDNKPFSTLFNFHGIIFAVVIAMCIILWVGVLISGQA